MKTKIKNIILILLTTILISITSFSKDFPVNKKNILSEKFLQNRIERKFPVNKNFLFGNIKLYNPIIKLINDRIYIEVDYSSSIFLSSFFLNKSSGRLYLNTKIEYNPKNENLYLTNFKIEKIITKNGNDISKNISLIKKIISEYLSINPVYQYRKEKPNTKVKIKRMYIENGIFYVQT